MTEISRNINSQETLASPHEINIQKIVQTPYKKRIVSDVFAGVGVLIVLLSFMLIIPGNSVHQAWFIACFLLFIIGFFSYRRLQDQALFNKLLSETTEIDSLTHINNRIGLTNVLNREISRSNRIKTPFSVLMIDIDDFKTINDLYGQKIGDRILQHIAGILGNSVRVTDSIGRYGGEEFILILSHTEDSDAVLVADRVRKTVLKQPLYINSEPIIASVSIGVAEYNHELDTIDKLISRSNQALKRAKSQGKNQAVCWATQL